jgi:hypothetical protein
MGLGVVKLLTWNTANSKDENSLILLYRNYHWGVMWRSCELLLVLDKSWNWCESKRLHQPCSIFLHSQVRIQGSCDIVTCPEWFWCTYTLNLRCTSTNLCTWFLSFSFFSLSTLEAIHYLYQHTKIFFCCFWKPEHMCSSRQYWENHQMLRVIT